MKVYTIFALFKHKVTIKCGAAIKKGREGCHGRLIRPAVIKNGLEDGRGLLQGLEGRSGHLVHSAVIKKGRGPSKKAVADI